MLQKVNAIPGAIGYAPASAAADYMNLSQVQLDGAEATFAAVNVKPTQSQYPFWNVEYLYTFGYPEGGTLASAFLDYMNSAEAKEILRGQGYTPCIDGSTDLRSTLCVPPP